MANYIKYDRRQISIILKVLYAFPFFPEENIHQRPNPQETSIQIDE
jgi:hypothetical protein